MGAEVHRERHVPILRAGARQTATAPDPDVEHEAIEWTCGHDRLDEAVTLVFARHVGHENRRLAAFADDPLRRLVRGLGVAVSTQDFGTLSGREHGDGAAVADGRVLVVRWLRTGADDEDPLAGQPRRSHPSNPGTPGSRCTPSEFNVNDTKWYWPTTIGTSISCASS